MKFLKNKQEKSNRFLYIVKQTIMNESYLQMQKFENKVTQ